MSLLTKAIARLSQLEIDADKDWKAKKITNLRAIADAMAHGDIAFRGVGILEKLEADAGKGYNFLRSRGPGLSPVWEDIEALVQYMTGALNRAAAVDLAIPVPSILHLTQQASSPPGRTGQAALDIFQPDIAVETATGPGGGVTAAQPLSVPAPSITKVVASGNPVDGAVADDGGVQTDETAAANSDTPNDMTLLPAAPAVGDAYYFGLGSFWDYLRLNIGTGGVGVWTLAWEYWNGSIWAPLADVDDGTAGFSLAGWHDVAFTRPSDWATITIGGIASFYWIRARVFAFTSITAQPLGTRALCFIVST